MDNGEIKIILFQLKLKCNIQLWVIVAIFRTESLWISLSVSDLIMVCIPRTCGVLSKTHSVWGRGWAWWAEASAALLQWPPKKNRGSSQWCITLNLHKHHLKTHISLIFSCSLSLTHTGPFKWKSCKKNYRAQLVACWRKSLNEAANVGSYN